MSQKKKHNNKQNTNKPNNPLPRAGMPLKWIFIGVIVIMLLTMLNQHQKLDEIKNNEFEQYIANGMIKSVEIGEREITGIFNAAGIQAREAKAPQAANGFQVD